MQRTDLSDMQCPIARSLERVGEWWSILIMRDAFYGITRFDAFQKSLSIAPNILARRLNTLVEAGLLERQRYSERPPRDEYLLTARGRDFRPVVQALLAWGNRQFAPEGASVVYANTETGEIADPVMIDRISGRPMSDPVFRPQAGPAANEWITRRMAAINVAAPSVQASPVEASSVQASSTGEPAITPQPAKASRKAKSSAA